MINKKFASSWTKSFGKSELEAILLALLHSPKHAGIGSKPQLCEGSIEIIQEG